MQVLDRAARLSARFAQAAQALEILLEPREFGQALANGLQPALSATSAAWQPAPDCGLTVSKARISSSDMSIPRHKRIKRSRCKSSAE